MTAFDIRDLLAAHRQGGRPYHEFLRVPALSTGLYALPAGANDPQQPHAEDEVYYVLEGEARFRAGDEDQAVQAGSVLFVPARVLHQFHSITRDLTLLVFFAPAESS